MFCCDATELLGKIFITNSISLINTQFCFFSIGNALSLKRICPFHPLLLLAENCLQYSLNLGYIMTSFFYSAAAAAKSLQSCPTLCNPTNGSPPGSAIPGILQARTLEWVAISFFHSLWLLKIISLIKGNNFTDFPPKILIVSISALPILETFGFWWWQWWCDQIHKRLKDLQI